MLIDTHCHIHDTDFELDPHEVIKSARAEGVSKLICVGTDGPFSEMAVKFASGESDIYATVGLHPHDAEKREQMEQVAALAGEKPVVAIGECGLDYFYDNSHRDIQKQVLVEHFEIAKAHNLPMAFHVRGGKNTPQDAFDDFWEIYDRYTPAGVIHSFSGSEGILEQILVRKLLVGLNGIVTFMKEGDQLDAIRAVPLESMVLETDAPLLTPAPFRGKINEPKHICTIVEFLSKLRGETVQQISDATTSNAQSLFGI